MKKLIFVLIAFLVLMSNYAGADCAQGVVEQPPEMPATVR